MVLQIYNTLSRKVEEFKPVKDGEVKVYICGLTVYDDMHIGHARTYLAFDAILRYLKYKGYNLKYIQNITDIDDKIIIRANEKNIDPLKLSGEFAERMFEDQNALGLLKADHYPKVSETIEEIIIVVGKLIDKGHAYEADGNVYFDVGKTPDYGKLSHQDTEQLDRHRIEPDPGKKSPLDFALWKKVGDEELGFESPWGRGRPGWHIECTVMSQKYLGDIFDIHGGARDLIFPHHENEVAQSEALTGKKPFVKYWMHTGFLNSSGEKMSKSLGNIHPVRDFLKNVQPDVFRLFILKSHYRSPIDYNHENIEAAKGAVERLRNFKKLLENIIRGANDDGRIEVEEDAISLLIQFDNHMDRDFDTPKALAALFEYVRKANSLVVEGGQSKKSLEKAYDTLKIITSVLGLQLVAEKIELTSEQEKLLKQREEHRKNKDWSEADRIRLEFEKQGLRLVDQKDGSTMLERIS